MTDSLGPRTNTRNTQKCSVCRTRRKKCIPEDRDWTNGQQKCDFCETRGLSCGPNLRCSDDPTRTPRAAILPENEGTAGSHQTRQRLRGHLDGSDITPAPTVLSPNRRRTQGRNDARLNTNETVEEGQYIVTTSADDLAERAKSKIDDFHALRGSLTYASQPTLSYCPAHRTQQTYRDLSIEEKIHEVFLDIHGVAIEAHDREEPDLARWILLALVLALEQCPRLLDSRKKHTMLGIARMFQELGLEGESESVFLKIAGMYKEQSGSAFPRELYHTLASSFSKSSQSRRRVLVDRWNETVRGGDLDASLNVGPLHTAVQHNYPEVIMALSSNPDDRSSSQLAPSSNIPHVGINTEERDLNGHTPLFAAVAKGDEHCCLALLRCNADANTRDEAGHTALEVAVRGRNLNIVKSLIEFGANVNPDITGCSSLPLHAAIEGEGWNFEIIERLLISGAEVDRRRFTDDKNAIDLAVGQGYHALAEQMIGMIPTVERTTFMSQDPFMGQITH